MEAMTVPGVLDSLSEIRAYVQRAAAAAQLDERRAYRLALAVDEIATNIVVHGYEESATSGDIRVSAQMEDGQLVVALSDTSPAYDPLQRERPDNLDTPLEEREIGGLGVFLARQNVDEFRYQYVDGENQNMFIVQRAAQADDPAA